MIDFQVSVNQAFKDGKVSNELVKWLKDEFQRETKLTDKKALEKSKEEQKIELR